MGHVPRYTALITLSMIVLYALIPAQGDCFKLLLLDKKQPNELWRYVSAHFLHFGYNHLLWNVLAAFVLGAIVEGYSRLFAFGAWLFGIAGVSTWFVFQQKFELYSGMSGALNSVFIATLYTLIKPSKNILQENKIVLAVFSVYLAKNAYEIFTGDAVFSETTWQPTPGAHIAGMLAGLTWISLWFAIKKEASEGL